MAIKTRQATFRSPEEKVRDVLARAGDRDFDRVICTVSGGTDSILATHLTAKYGPEYGIEPDMILHANTGAGVPQTQLTAQVLAAMHDIAYVEGNNGTLAERVLKHGWPADTVEGHFYERIERKSDVFDKIHSQITGEQLWISGARSTESKKRSTNVPDSGIESDDRRSRQTWASPCSGVTSGEKGEMIIDMGLPVSEAYLILGFSGECVACAHDDAGLLTDLDILAPNLAWAIRNLTAWLAFRARRGDVDITPKQLSWGWSPTTDDTADRSGQRSLNGDAADVEGDWIGCNSSSCGDRDIPEWVRDLPDWQIVDRADVERYWWGDADAEALVRRFNS